MAKQSQVLGFTRHPASAHWPGLDEEEFYHLLDAIKTDGQREAIVVTKAKRVVDGWHRLLVCERLGIKPTIETRNLKDHEAAKFAIRMHQSRRHLTKEQLARATLDTQLACGMTLADPGDRRNPGTQGGAPAGRVTAKSLSEDAGVSRKTAQRAIQDRKRAEGRLPPRPDPKAQPEPAPEEQSGQTGHPARKREPTPGAMVVPPEEREPDPVQALEQQLREAQLENERLTETIEDMKSAASPDQKGAIKKLQDAKALIATLKSQVNEWQTKHRDKVRDNKNLKRKITRLEAKIEGLTAPAAETEGADA